MYLKLVSQAHNLVYLRLVFKAHDIVNLMLAFKAHNLMYLRLVFKAHNLITVGRGAYTDARLCKAGPSAMTDRIE